VSLILSNTAPDRFRSTTRKRVRQAAAELRYEPRIKRAGATAVRGKLLSWMHPSPLNKLDRQISYDGDILASVIEAAHQEGWHVAVGNGFSSVADVQQYLNTHSRSTVDALILAGDLDPAILEYVGTQNLPAIYIHDTTRVSSAVHGIYADNLQGGRVAAKHLLDLGHRRFLVVGRRSRGYIRQRISGFQEPLLDRRLDESHVTWCDLDQPDFEESMARALESAGGITAVFVASGDDTMRVMAFMKRHAISIPEQLSLIGYDDWPESAMVKPPLTIVANSRKVLGELAFRRLLELSNQPGTPPVSILAPTELIVRASTAPPRPMPGA
jgi:LacI family transcriptional regulator